jgi:proteasome lid subunit RPN8/RPN11
VTSLEPALRGELIDRARSAAPDEACGLLLRASDGQLRLTSEPNLCADPRLGFAIDPLAVLRAESAGANVVGVWHSHPAGPALPSDRDEAARDTWPGLAHVIVGLRPTPRVAVYRGPRVAGTLPTPWAPRAS